YEQIHRERPEYEIGARSVYSDLGFMLLGELIELLSRMPLDRFCHERIFRPLGLRASAFVDLTAVRTRRLTPVTDLIAPTERCPWRQRILCGEVHDDNAYAMGGVAGHAGLFANAAAPPATSGRAPTSTSTRRPARSSRSSASRSSTATTRRASRASTSWCAATRSGARTPRRRRRRPAGSACSPCRRPWRRCSSP